MSLQFPGFDTAYLFRLLGDFWDSYKERPQIACTWSGIAQLMDDQYLQLYQQDFSKSLQTVPVYWRYNWSNLVLDDWEANEVFHKHYFVQRTTTGGETSFNLGDLIAPEAFHPATKLHVNLEGVELAEGTDYTYSGGVLSLVAALDAGLDLTISWVDPETELPYHDHLEFAEELAATKSTWTNASGDAFDPDGQGAYVPGEAQQPIEIWVNGAREPVANYVETDSKHLTLNVTNPPVAGDRVVVRWVRNQTDPNPHMHYKYNYQVHASREDLFRLPFRVTNGAVAVYVNGALLDASQYEFTESSLLHLLADLDRDDLLEVDYRYKEYRWRHAVDARIVSAPLLQDGIDKPTLVSTQGVNHEFRDGYLYCDYCGTDGFDDIWAPNLWTNEGVIASNFGAPIDFSRENSANYLYGTRGLWNVYWHGPAIANVEGGAKIVLDVPVAPADTTVSEIVENDDGSHTIRLAIGVDLEVPAELNPIVIAGQAVVAYQPLADGVEVYDYVKDPEWWRRVPGFHRMWSYFGVSSEPWTGRFDDRGLLDDGGYFDDAGNNIEVDQKLFDLIKYFTFLVIVNSKLISNSQDAYNITHFVDSIKPAYTKPIKIVSNSAEDNLAIGETVSLELIPVGS